jgi:hypothetical protein
VRFELAHHYYCPDWDDAISQYGNPVFLKSRPSSAAAFCALVHWLTFCLIVRIESVPRLNSRASGTSVLDSAERDF